MSSHGNEGPAVYGVMAEFDTADKLVEATQKATDAGYTLMDGYSPYPVGGVADAMKYEKSEMAPLMFIGGLLGATAGFIMQYWTNGVGYPINVGGRPFMSWPSFIPITFELMVLTTALSGVFGLFISCGLPQPYHPVFHVPQFVRASCDRFFLCIEARDPKFEMNAVKDFMNGLQALSVAEVPE